MFNNIDEIRIEKISDSTHNYKVIVHVGDASITDRFVAIEDVMSYLKDLYTNNY
jgi:hypothetical protein